jgi:hypothetical protein
MPRTGVNMEKQTSTRQEKIMTITLWSLIGLIVLFIIMVLYIPKLSMNVIGVGSYQALTGYDSTLDRSDMLLVKHKPFDELVSGDIIVFNLKGYGNSDGVKAYSIMARPNPNYYHVHSTGQVMSFPWNVTEDMYVGVVQSSVPYVGAVTGFFGSIYGIAVLIVNGLIIIGIVYLVKENKKQSKNLPEE